LNDTQFNEYKTLCEKRRHAAFDMVGVVSACLHIARTFKEPVDAKPLQMTLDKYEAADRAIEAFTLLVDTESLVTR
jgi:hypothetical protein